MKQRSLKGLIGAALLGLALALGAVAAGPLGSSAAPVQVANPGGGNNGGGGG